MIIYKQGHNAIMCTRSAYNEDSQCTNAAQGRRGQGIEGLSPIDMDLAVSNNNLAHFSQAQISRDPFLHVLI